ncbi:hypothetical protein ASG01_13275 [Chryseobacterium sp. Leaf180]|uniref:hypothetical protein n=1 Tax=Chryseobacterium sp. Leaf180 TaxID=1736289 RepID=UPI0006F686F2|nr:hypothetical protein [Chryseobacterium sp. Leaf180]KQR91966.1 hypothetical protein ASG01_13275 [Chryseobacterium sp. Leaf180]
MIKKFIFAGAFLCPFIFNAQQETMKSSEPRVAVIPHVGYGYRLAKAPSDSNPETRKYINGLRGGLDVGIGAFYLLNGNGAVGIKGSLFSASSTGRITVQTGSGTSTSLAVNTDDNISFIGASYMFSNFKSDTKHKLLYDIALGVITYTTKTGNVKGVGSSLGADINFAYQYAVTDNIFIGPKLGLIGGTITKMKYNGVVYDFPEDQGEGLTRLSLSAAATFRF